MDTSHGLLYQSEFLLEVQAKTQRGRRTQLPPTLYQLMTQMKLFS